MAEGDAILRDWQEEALLHRIEQARKAGQDDRVAHLQYLRLANALRGFRLADPATAERQRRAAAGRRAAKAYERALQ